MICVSKLQSCLPEIQSEENWLEREREEERLNSALRVDERVGETHDHPQ